METLESTIARLEVLERAANNGRGFSACRGLIRELRRGHFDVAVAVVNNEWDKFRNYPEIAAILKSVGLAPEHWR